ncbi:sporulation protein YpjB [Priestia megaterium]|nr:sporulation protein YpjB [Priestia megaterium]
MKGRIIIILLLVFFGFTTVVNASNNKQWEKLNRLADETLSLVQQEKYDEAKEVFEQFSDEFSSPNIHSLNISAEDIQILTITYEQVERALIRPESNPEEKLQKAIQFRLLVDALNSEHQPLWTEMEGRVLTTFKEMKSSISQGETSEYKAGLQQFLQEYDTILPSAKVDVLPAYMERVDEHVNLLRNQSQVEQINAQKLVQIEQDLKAFFENIKEDETDPSVIWVMITTGSIIILTLLYVGFRKYGADKRKRSERERND